MNRVGDRGHAARASGSAGSCYATLTRFAPLCERRGDRARAAQLRAASRGAAPGARGRRGTANGIGAGTTTTARRSGRRKTPSARSIRSRSRGPCSSGAASRSAPRRRWTRVRRAPGPRGRRLILLLDAAVRSDRRRTPATSRRYPPGVRENGGQYTHAAVWLLWAFAELGEGDQAVALFQKLLPVHHARTRDAAERYRVEPYVVAADVYGAPPGPAAADGRGTRARRDGPIASASRRSSASVSTTGHGGSIRAFRDTGRDSR